MPSQVKVPASLSSFQTKPEASTDISKDENCLRFIKSVKNLLDFAVRPKQMDDFPIDDNLLVSTYEKGYCINLADMGYTYKEKRYRIYYTKEPSSKNENWATEVGKCMAKSHASSLTPFILRRFEFIKLLQSAKESLSKSPSFFSENGQLKEINHSVAHNTKTVTFGPLISYLTLISKSSHNHDNEYVKRFCTKFLQDTIDMTCASIRNGALLYRSVDIILPDEISETSDELSCYIPNKSMYRKNLESFFFLIFDDDLGVKEKSVKEPDAIFSNPKINSGDLLQSSSQVSSDNDSTIEKTHATTDTSIANSNGILVGHEVFLKKIKNILEKTMKTSQTRRIARSESEAMIISLRRGYCMKYHNKSYDQKRYRIFYTELLAETEIGKCCTRSHALSLMPCLFKRIELILLLQSAKVFALKLQNNENGTLSSSDCTATTREGESICFGPLIGILVSELQSSKEVTTEIPLDLYLHFIQDTINMICSQLKEATVSCSAIGIKLPNCVPRLSGDLSYRGSNHTMYTSFLKSFVQTIFQNDLQWIPKDVIKIEKSNTNKISVKRTSSISTVLSMSEENVQRIEKPLASALLGVDIKKLVSGHIGMICKIQEILQYANMPMKIENIDIEDQRTIIYFTRRGYCLNIRNTGCTYDEMRFRIFFAEMQKSQKENWEVEIGKCQTKSIATSLYPCLLKRIEFILLLQNAKRSILTLPFDMTIGDERRSVPTSHCNASSESSERVCFGPLLTEVFSKLNSSSSLSETIPLDFYLDFIKDTMSLISSCLTTVIPSYSGIDIMLPDDIPQPLNELSYSGPNCSMYEKVLQQFVECIFQDDLKWLSNMKMKKKDNKSFQGTQKNKRTKHDEIITDSANDLPDVGYDDQRSLAAASRTKPVRPNKRSWIKTAPTIVGPFRVPGLFNKHKNNDSNTKKVLPANKPISQSQHKKVKYSHVLIPTGTQVSTTEKPKASKKILSPVPSSDIDQTSKFEQPNQNYNISKLSRQTICKKRLTKPFGIRNDPALRNRSLPRRCAIDNISPPSNNYRRRSHVKFPSSRQNNSIENESESNAIEPYTAKNEGLILKFKRLGKKVNTCQIFVGGPYSLLQIDDLCTMRDVLAKTKGILYDPPANQQLVVKIKLSKKIFEFPVTDAHLMTIRGLHELLDLEMSADILLEETPLVIA